MRGKEEASDYRYFPEPDLPPLVIEANLIDEIRREMPELPQERKVRFSREYEIPEYDAQVLTANKSLADFYEDTVKLFPEAKMVSNWVMGDVLRVLRERRIEVSEFPVPPENLARMLNLIHEGTISGKIAKKVFDEMVNSGEAPDAIIEKRGLVQISDEGALEEMINSVLEGNPKEVEAFLAGKDKLFGFFVGQVMKASRGKANPQLVNQMLRKKLDDMRETCCADLDSRNAAFGSGSPSLTFRPLFCPSK
jgi:aspartyl-tRNA(Asn)/glutamyl-tRNA(Gln) amidotransferase subunit B